MIGKWMAGTAVGVLVGWVAKMAYDSWKETKELLKEGEKFDTEVDAIVELARDDLEQFDKLVNRSFNDENLDDAIEASIELARRTGVPEDQILHDMEEVDKFFLE